MTAAVKITHGKRTKSDLLADLERREAAMAVEPETEPKQTAEELAASQARADKAWADLRARQAAGKMTSADMFGIGKWR